MSRVRFSGWQAWPDHPDEHAWFVLCVGRRLAFGIGGRVRGDWNPWVSIYLGWWAIELYWDRERSSEEAES